MNLKFFFPSSKYTRVTLSSDFEIRRMFIFLHYLKSFSTPKNKKLSILV